VLVCLLWYGGGRLEAFWFGRQKRLRLRTHSSIPPTMGRGGRWYHMVVWEGVFVLVLCACDVLRCAECFLSALA